MYSVPRGAQGSLIITQLAEEHFAELVSEHACFLSLLGLVETQFVLSNNGLFLYWQNVSRGLAAIRLNFQKLRAIFWRPHCRKSVLLIADDDQPTIG